MNNKALTTLALAMLWLPHALSANVIDADASGNWYNPEQAGHGLQIEVLNLSEAVVAWYTFDAQGDPLWLIGNGEIQGDTLRAELAEYSGTRFPPNFDPDEIEGTGWGEVVFQRTGCNEASLEWMPVSDDYAGGEMSLQRLTRIDGQRCNSPYWESERRFTPATNASGFEARFFDYPDGESEFFELEAGFRPLPEPWDDRGGVMIRGNNHSDDLMMVLYRRLGGLEPDTEYNLELAMQFATNVPAGCVGVGGPPGESVYVRLGAAGEAPDHEVVDGYRRAKLDLGQQSSAGADALSVGDMTSGADGEFCTGAQAPWHLKRVSTAGQDFTVTSDENGRIWVYGLSDSGFEATTVWFLTEFVVRLARAD